MTEMKPDSSKKNEKRKEKQTLMFSSDITSSGRDTHPL